MKKIAIFSAMAHAASQVIYNAVGTGAPNDPIVRSANFKYGRTVSAQNTLSQKGRRKRAKWSRK